MIAQGNLVQAKQSKTRNCQHKHKVELSQTRYLKKTISLTLKIKCMVERGLNDSPEPDMVNKTLSLALLYTCAFIFGDLTQDPLNLPKALRSSLKPFEGL